MIMGDWANMTLSYPAMWPAKNTEKIIRRDLRMSRGAMV